MSSIYKRDGNGKAGMVRDGAAETERIILTPSDVTANTWARWMPSGNAGEKTDDYRLELGTIRATMVPHDFYGWTLKILNEGYFQQCQIAQLESDGTCDLLDPLKLPGTPDDDLEWVIYPEMLDKCALMMDQGSPAAITIDIGHTPLDKYTPDSDEIRQIFDLRVGSLETVYYYKGTDLDKLFYRFESAPPNNAYLVWGDFEMGI